MLATSGPLLSGQQVALGCLWRKGAVGVRKDNKRAYICIVLSPVSRDTPPHPTPIHELQGGVQEAADSQVERFPFLRRQN